MPYGLLDYARLESRFNQPYGIFDPVPAFFTGTVRAAIGSHIVPLIDWQIETDEGRSYLQADLQLLRPADYSRFKLNGAFTLEIFGQSYSLIVDSKSQPRSRDAGNNPQIEMRIQGISPAAKRDFPRAQALTKTWDEPIMASAAAQEAAGLPITWNMVDWMIPAFRLAVVDASPMAVARPLAILDILTEMSVH